MSAHWQAGEIAYYTVPAGGRVQLPSAMRRTYMMLTVIQQSITVAKLPVPAGAGVWGIAVLAGGVPVELCACHHGDLLRQELVAINPGGVAAYLTVASGYEPYPPVGLAEMTEWMQARAAAMWREQK
jgi:hypothetical protein